MADSNRKRQSPFGEGWDLLKATFHEWWGDDTFRFSASLAFYTIFSIAPILLIATGVASLFLARETAVEKIVNEIQRLVGEQGANAVRQVLEASRGFGRSAWAIGVGLVTLLIGATTVFAELQTALNKIWDVQAEPRHGVMIKLIVDRVRSFAIAFGVGFLLLVSLVLSAAISAVQDYLDAWMPGMPWLWQTLNIVISLGAVTWLFAMIYKYLPDAKLAWKDVWVGAATTAVLFTAGKFAIGVYLGHTATASAFGAAGSFAVLLIWVYYSALICFFGAEFTQVYARRHGVGIRPEAHARRANEK